MKFIIVVLSLAKFISCNDDYNDNSTSCDSTTLISEEQYLSAPSDHLEINNLEIDGDCLTIRFSSGGYNGDSWESKLIDSEDILYSHPPQRNLRLSLKNEEECEAYIIKEITFDISNLQVEGNKVLQNITNSEDSILYQY